MDNESEHSASTRIEGHVEQPKTPPPQASTERVWTPPRPSHGRSGLPPQLQSLRPASLPVPSAMRPPPTRHTTPPTNENAERSRALRESLFTERPRPEAVEIPVNIAPEYTVPDQPRDPREEEILKLVAASTPSHRSAWKRNSKAWQVFLSRRERRAGEIAPEAIEEEGSYILDDFDSQLGHRFNGIADSDVTDEDEADGKSFFHFTGSRTLTVLQTASGRMAMTTTIPSPSHCQCPLDWATTGRPLEYLHMNRRRRCRTARECSYPLYAIPPRQLRSDALRTPSVTVSDRLILARLTSRGMMSTRMTLTATLRPEARPANAPSIY